MSMKKLISTLSVSVFSATWIIPAQAEVPGHTYVYTDMEMQLYEPAQKIKIRDGEVSCNTYGYGYLAQTNCTTSEPVYIERPARSYSRILRVTIDCTDETFDAQGDGKPWNSIRNDAEVYRVAMERCSGSNSTSIINPVNTKDCPPLLRGFSLCD
jgi:hypothetical protein